MLKVLLSNKLKYVECCQTLLVGENEKNNKTTNTEKGKYPTVGESYTTQANKLYIAVSFLTAVDSTALKAQTNVLQPLQNIPMSKSFTNLSNCPSSPVTDFCIFIFMYWRSIC